MKLTIAAVVAATLCFVPHPSSAQQLGQDKPEFAWSKSLPLNPRDSRIGQIGGTEIRALQPFDGKLFAAVGYWQDTQKDNPALPGAQVLRLDDTGSAWRVDLELNDRNPRGLRLYQAIATLQDVRFGTDRNGQQLSSPVDLLLAAVWKRGTGIDVFSRVSGSGARMWTKTALPGEQNAARGTQIRAFGLHHDQVTGQDIVFAGATDLILTGRYDPERSAIAWDASPEWQSQYQDGPSARGRVSSFTECNGKFYAAAYDTIYERTDGAKPTWKVVHQTTIHALSDRVTGFRGLTCVRGPSGSDVLLAGVEDNPARIYRIDPANQFAATLELDVSAYLTKMLKTQSTYTIVAYNNMIEYPGPSCTRYLMGIGTNTPEAPKRFGEQHNVDAYFLVRGCDGTYALQQVIDPKINPRPQLVAVRALSVSPFSSDPSGTIYSGGFDTSRNPVHNTAWIYKGVPAQSSGESAPPPAEPKG